MRSDARSILERLAALLFPSTPQDAPAPLPPLPPFPEGPVRLDAEDCVAAADRAMGEEQWALAAAWLTRARDMAPTSVRVRTDLAFALAQAGRPDEALRTYDEAALLAPEPGEPLFHAAMLARALGRAEEAETRLHQALAADPSLAGELDGDLVPRARGHRRDERRP